jgi:hypothetical protein
MGAMVWMAYLIAIGGAHQKYGGPFNEPEHATYYGGDHGGYTDYPTLDEA